jgi:hypothetical protein
VAGERRGDGSGTGGEHGAGVARNIAYMLPVLAAAGTHRVMPLHPIGNNALHIRNHQGGEGRHQGRLNAASRVKPLSGNVKWRVRASLCRLAQRVRTSNVNGSERRAKSLCEMNLLTGMLNGMHLVAWQSSLQASGAHSRGCCISKRLY